MPMTCNTARTKLFQIAVNITEAMANDDGSNLEALRHGERCAECNTHYIVSHAKFGQASDWMSRFIV